MAVKQNPILKCALVKEQDCRNICTCSSSDDENHCENVCKDADNKENDENVDAEMKVYCWLSVDIWIWLRTKYFLNFTWDQVIYIVISSYKLYRSTQMMYQLKYTL